MNNNNDLGLITRPLLICGGAYGNLEALQALSRWAGLHGFDDAHIIHTGDAVAYCADAAAASRFIRTRNWASIKGNVEEQLAAGADDCACGFAEGSVCNVMSAHWFAYADRTVSADDRKWMAALPATLTFTMSGRRFMVVHGAVDQTNRFMFESLDTAEFACQLELAGTDAVIAGHTGIPFTRSIGPCLWHNSGALGMPANDGTRRVWFSTLTPQVEGIHIRHHALIYEHDAAAAKLRSADLPQGYADGLQTGLWPSRDILPGTECAATGTPLRLDDVVWRADLAQAV
jgi:predicted phosphodiesterase